MKGQQKTSVIEYDSGPLLEESSFVLNLLEKNNFLLKMDFVIFLNNHTTIRKTANYPVRRDEVSREESPLALTT